MLSPVKNEVFADLDNAFIRLHNSGFTKGILLVKESINSRKGHWQIDYSRYHKTLKTGGRHRPETAEPWDLLLSN
jgi:hypothetical protein